MASASYYRVAEHIELGACEGFRIFSQSHVLDSTVNYYGNRLLKPYGNGRAGRQFFLC